MLSSLGIFNEKRGSGRKLSMVSLYDAPSAEICCAAGVDALLVGDSLGNVILGYSNTINVTLRDMECHGAAVVRGVQRAGSKIPVIIDMPFGSYHGSRDSIVDNAATLMRVQAQGLKLEGAAKATLEAIELLVALGVPVMGHLGFTPQSSLRMQEIVQGKTPATAERLLLQARSLQQAGCFAVVLEAVPREVAQAVTNALDIPTIGIGAGPACDGQVLIWHDMMGLTPQTPYKFVKQFANLHQSLKSAAAAYAAEVREGIYPAEEHSWAMPEDELKAWSATSAADPPDNENC